MPVVNKKPDYIEIEDVDEDGLQVHLIDNVCCQLQVARCGHSMGDPATILNKSDCLALAEFLNDCADRMVT